jgi:hypothetical protein
VSAATIVAGPCATTGPPCSHSHWINTMLRCVFIAAVVASFSLPALAQVQRNFPANALRGEIAVTQPPDLLLNGKPARLAPGARIRGLDNMLLLTGALGGQRAVVNFTLDTQGLILDMWLLRPDERSKQPWPSSPEQAAAWQFDPAAQTWSRP